MSGIYNVNSDKFNFKKLSNTINLRIGQRVYGRVIGKGENNEAIIKLVNGLEIQADLEGVIKEYGEAPLSFDVSGYKDGKLFLKVVNKGVEQNPSSEGELLKFINREGFSKEDIPLIEAMLKYDIPLDKENLSKVKSLFQFHDKISSDENEIKNFIDKYLLSKDIDPNSEKGQAAINTLQKFFNQFKNLSKDTMLLFLENHIDMTLENLESYKNIFQGNNGLDELLKKLDNIYVKELIIPKDISDDSLAEVLKVEPKGIEEKINKEALKGVLSSILRDNGIILKEDHISKVFNIINKIPKEYFSKDSLEVILTKILDKDVSISQDKFNLIIDRSSEKIANNNIIKGQSKNIDSLIKVSADGINRDLNNDTKVIGKEEELKNFDNNNDKKYSILNNMKENISSKSETAKEIIRTVLNLIELDTELKSSVLQSIKSEINDVKILNKFNEEYYYMNFPVEVNEREYPCKLIIKDNRKSGKQIDSKNIKIAVNIDTKNFGKIDFLIKVSSSNMNIEVRSFKSFIKIFDISKERLKEDLKDLGYSVNISVSEVVDEFSFESCRDFFDHNGVAGIDVKV